MVSVIVPVYNVESYLEKCLDSIVNQTFRNIEIILVDDGSTDISHQIMEVYADKDQRVTLIHQSNKGVSAARNTGLFQAKGDYILFVDSDDYIIPETISTLYKRAIDTDAEIIIGKAFRFNHEGSKVHFYHRPKRLEKSNDLQKGEALYAELVRSYSFPPLTGLYFIKRSFVFANQLFFKERIIHEDELWCTQAILSSNKVLLLNFNYYCYIMRLGSIMTSSDISFRIKCYYIVAMELEMFTYTHPLLQESKGWVYVMILRQCFSMSQICNPSDKWIKAYRTFCSKLLQNNYSTLTYEQQRICLTLYCQIHVA
jgi:glycosyltransferase involved in cell wall biosynthesis